MTRQTNADVFSNQDDLTEFFQNESKPSRTQPTSKCQLYKRYAMTMPEDERSYDDYGEDQLQEEDDDVMRTTSMTMSRGKITSRNFEKRQQEKVNDEKRLGESIDKLIGV